MPGEHAALGASNAHRWRACPGSVEMEARQPERDPGPYAIKGTAAHKLAEECLQKGLDAGQFATGEHHVSVEVTDGEFEAVPVTDEMAKAVQVYLDHVRSLMESGTELHIEQRVSLEKLDPPRPMFGTADTILWNEMSGRLDVADYKNGRGVVVEVEDNDQPLYYLLGAVLLLGQRPEEMHIHIVQPRAHHPDGPVRSREVTWEELVEFRQGLIADAEATIDPDAPLSPGDHCKFCAAKPVCPALHETAVSVAQQEFGEIESEESFPEPNELTVPQITEVLDKAVLVEDWLNSLRAHAQTLLEQGAVVPGYKLVEKRATRRWTDEEEAEAWLRQRFLVGDIFKKKLVSPYQAEQLLKDRPRTDLPDEFVERHVSGLKLAREDNPRPAVTPALQAADEFTADEEE